MVYSQKLDAGDSDLDNLKDEISNEVARHMMENARIEAAKKRRAR
ncbi:MAG TPA: hypothetical protein VEI57_06560 [Nitrospirota bacterium]|nr:hypothetical protein [Nitrospirota bacterium]